MPATEQPAGGSPSYPAARNSGPGPAAAATASRQPVPVFRRRDRGADRSHRHAARPVRRATFAALIGLLAVTGIRVGEAIDLDRGDVDLPTGRLLVRCGKFGKARELVLQPSTVDALRGYLKLRDRAAAATGASALLVSAVPYSAMYPWPRRPSTCMPVTRTSAGRLRPLPRAGDTGAPRAAGSRSHCRRPGTAR